jgi:hypothetical protein
MAAPKGNKNALGNDGGRPALFNSPEELQSKVDEYFNGGANTKEYPTLAGSVKIPIYTISGIAYFLGFSARQSFYDYENRVEFSDIIKKARLRIEMNYEENLIDKACTGSIFALKNMGWSDKSEIDHTVNIPTLPDVIIKRRER